MYNVLSIYTIYSVYIQYTQYIYNVLSMYVLSICKMISTVAKRVKNWKQHFINFRSLSHFWGLNFILRLSKN